MVRKYTLHTLLHSNFLVVLMLIESDHTIVKQNRQAEDLADIKLQLEDN